jgi:hypothetical protein
MPRTLAAASIAMIALATAAFWRTYVSLSPGSSSAYVHFHAIVGVFWLLILVVQPILFLRRSLELHRLVGRISWVIAPLFFISAVLLAHFRFSRMDRATFVEEAYTLYLPLSASLLFAGAYVCALCWRRNARLHARLMACTGLVVIDPVLGRVLGFYVVDLAEFRHYQIITFGIEFALLLLMTLTLPPSGADRRVFGGFAGVFALVQGLWFLVPRTAAWTSLAEWFRGLPLT